MVSCLALIQDSHALLGQANGLNNTACGMAIADQHVEDGLFADDPATATCGKCKTALQSPRGVTCATGQKVDSKTLIRRLIDEVLNANSTGNLAKIASGEILFNLSQGRLSRMHELFEGWNAQIDDLIAEDSRIVVRYQVTYADMFGLMGSVGPAVRRNQFAIFDAQDGYITRVSAVVDDFGIWSAAPEWPECPAKCQCCSGVPSSM
ncbi:hypothetical protein PQR05_34365 [Paraburkholderia sediminicola]|uniref:hypothetical protein n=1 Tax=Paraburkholderia sediminicola TaxID=458836 RepID=UPI0038BCFA3F